MNLQLLQANYSYWWHVKWRHATDQHRDAPINGDNWYRLLIRSFTDISIGQLLHWYSHVILYVTI